METNQVATLEFVAQTQGKAAMGAGIVTISIWYLKQCLFATGCKFAVDQPSRIRHSHAVVTVWGTRPQPSLIAHHSVRERRHFFFFM
jgi:hypothetical protein